MKQTENRLAGQSSPYLIQHQSNPVAWQPWDEYSLKQAEARGKPILLSIGYSACHWCHIMAQESFEDPATALLMNEKFINIKVDREERPDLDEIYQLAHQLITGTPGGWPLTVFLCPKTRLPFIAGTYFPKVSSNGKVGFQDLLMRVDDLYHKRGGDFANMREKVRHSYIQLAAALETTGTNELEQTPVLQAVERLLEVMDPNHGGFVQAPKFVLPYHLERLLWAVNKKGDHPVYEGAIQALRLTLLKMSVGGICDMVNGGFFRYSTDEHWEIPHFEKMMYDNGPLLGLYARAAELFSDDVFEDTARSIAQWMTSDMQSQEDVFYTSVHADNEDGEGRYYLWTRASIQRILEPEEYALVSALCGLEGMPNFEGYWHLHQVQNLSLVASQLQLPRERALNLWDKIRYKLRMHRHVRSNILRDEKILCTVNALAIKGLAQAARALDESSYLYIAQTAVDFIGQHLWINSRLFSTWQLGKAKISGYLDDYALLMDALLELLQLEWRDSDYRLLVGLAESMLNNFEDREQGGFFSTPHDHEPLIYRNKPLFDSVTPSGGGVAAKVLVRLGRLATEPRYLEAAERALKNAWPSITRQPEAHHNFLLALEELLDPSIMVLLTGDESMAFWQEQVHKKYKYRVLCYWIPHDCDLQPPEAAVMDANHGMVCVGEDCSAPQVFLDDLLALVSEKVREKNTEERKKETKENYKLNSGSAL